MSSSHTNPDTDTDDDEVKSNAGSDGEQAEPKTDVERSRVSLADEDELSNSMQNKAYVTKKEKGESAAGRRVQLVKDGEKIFANSLKHAAELVLKNGGGRSETFLAEDEYNSRVHTIAYSASNMLKAKRTASYKGYEWTFVDALSYTPAKDVKGGDHSGKHCLLYEKATKQSNTFSSITQAVQWACDILEKADDEHAQAFRKKREGTRRTNLYALVARKLSEQDSHPSYDCYGFVFTHVQAVDQPQPSVSS